MSGDVDRCGVPAWWHVCWQPRRQLVAILAALCVLFVSQTVSGQAVWSGGNGRWTDNKWSGGTGAAGQPGAGQNVVFPSATGAVTLDQNLLTNVGHFAGLSQQGGTLRVEPNGALAFSNNLRLADGSSALGTLVVAGHLDVGGGVDVGFGSGNAAGNAHGILVIQDAARLSIGANLDTWWDDGAEVVVNGGDAEIEIGGTFFLGTAATIHANINSDRFSTIRVLGDVSFPEGDGRLNVDFVDGFIPTVGTSWTLVDTTKRSGTIPQVIMPDVPYGTRLSLEYGQGGDLGQVVTLEYENILNLRVESNSGEAYIENPAFGGEPLEIDGYIIRSKSASLEASALISLGDGWLPALTDSQSSSLISETNFESFIQVSTGDSISIGPIIQMSEPTDITFEFRMTDGSTRLGTVQFVEGLLGDFNGNGRLDTLDINDLTAQAASLAHRPDYDLNSDGMVDSLDVGIWIGPLFHSWVGDANLDGRFDSDDLIDALSAATYEAQVGAVWTSGDFNGNGRFDSSDLIDALADGGYEAGPRIASVPEPSALGICGFALWPLIRALRRRAPLGTRG